MFESTARVESTAKVGSAARVESTAKVGSAARVESTSIEEGAAVHGTSTSAAHESPLLNVTASASEAVRALVELACDCTGHEAPAPALGSAPADHALVEAIGHIERMKNSLDAAQSQLEVQLRHVRVRAEREAGLPAAKAGSGATATAACSTA